MIKVGMSKIDLEKALDSNIPIREERIEGVSLYIENKNDKFVWVVLDFMDFNYFVVNEIKKEVHNKTKIDKEHIHILTTHNHGGGEPDAYKLSKLVADCVTTAIKNSKEVLMRYALTKVEDKISFNRRKYIEEINGKTTMFYGVTAKTNYDASPHIESVLNELKNGSVPYWGEVPTTRPFNPFEDGDNEVVAVQFIDKNNETVGTIVRFAAHAVCSNLPNSFSADFPWQVRRKMQEKFGGVSLFFNGPCADLAPSLLKKNDGTSKIIGEHIALVAIKALEEKNFEPLTIANDKMSNIKLKVRKEVLNNKVEIPKEIPTDLKERFKYFEKKNLDATLPFLREKYAEGIDKLNEYIDVKLGLMQLNDLYFVAFPGETFSTTGYELKNHFKNKAICTVTEHDRTAMYMPPKEEFLLGGYETTCMMIESGEELKLKNSAIKALDNFIKETTL